MIEPGLIVDLFAGGGGAAWRVARALGYQRLITYTLQVESGASLRGAGWRVVGERAQRSWNTPGRPRAESPATGDKLLWEIRTTEVAI